MTYIVLAIKNGYVLFRGTSLTQAATALRPGTTFGSAYSESKALRQAQERRAWHLENAA